MTEKTQAAASSAELGVLVVRLRDESDLCRNEGATDIAALLDEAADAIERLRARVLALEAVHEDASGAVLQERERCAKLCERIASRDGLQWPGKPRTYFSDDGIGCAAAIRLDGM